MRLRRCQDYWGTVQPRLFLAHDRVGDTGDRRVDGSRFFPRHSSPLPLHHYTAVGTSNMTSTSANHFSFIIFLCYSGTMIGLVRSCILQRNKCIVPMRQCLVATAESKNNRHEHTCFLPTLRMREFLYSHSFYSLCKNECLYNDS